MMTYIQETPSLYMYNTVLIFIDETVIDFSPIFFLFFFSCHPTISAAIYLPYPKSCTLVLPCWFPDFHLLSLPYCFQIFHVIECNCIHLCRVISLKCSWYWNAVVKVKITEICECHGHKKRKLSHVHLYGLTLGLCLA